MLIKITDFKGLITNADVEDIPSDHLVVMKNMRNVFGKAVKTFEFGEVLDELAGVNNIYTFLNNYLSDPEDGYRYDAIVINSITKILTLYRWTGAAWETTSLYETFYHKYARNPIILNGGTVRIFPGNVGYAVGTTEAKPIWIDYIDMKHFDELYTPAAGFNGYPAIINTPALYPTITEINKGFTGFTSGNVYYYKFSYIYDGIQEGLLSAPTVWTVSDVNRIPKITFTININTFIRRITAIKVYRYESDALPSIDADFKHIHTIELNRVKADLFYG
ncbi:MAG: hypothetical protein ABIG69_20705, partial [Bacteroidota bacterium]